LLLATTIVGILEFSILIGYSQQDD